MYPSIPPQPSVLLPPPHLPSPPPSTMPPLKRPLLTFSVLPLAPFKRPRLSPTRALWLDLLPLDIQVRIANYVSTTPDDSLLTLIQVSPAQRQAVLLSLSYRLDLRGVVPHSNVSSLAWANVFADAVKYLRCHPYRMGTFTDVYFLRLLASPCLRVAEIWDDCVYLDSIRGARSLRMLRILVRGRSSVQCVVNALRSLRLCRLEVVCKGYEEGGRCALHDLVRASHGGVPPLARACSGVKQLCIECRHGDSLRQLLPHTHRLNELTLLRRPGKKVVDKLREVQTVRLKGFQGGYELAMMLGVKVKWLLCTEVLTSEQVKALKTCHRLEVARLILEDGAEEAIEEVVREWQGLRGLDLSWVERGRAISGLFGRFYRVREGVLSRAVSCMPALRVLHFVNVRLATAEVVCMLKTVGRSLVSFGVSILGQSDGCARRLCTLMYTIWKHNPELRECFVSDPRPERFRRCRVSSWGKWLVVLLARLRTTAPLLDVEHLSKVIEWLTKRVPDFVEPLREHEFETMELW